MPTDTEIWNAACEKAGLGVKPNQKAYCPEHGRACIGDEGCCCANKHQRFPAINEPAAVVAMLAWLPAGYSVLKLQGGWCVMPLHSSTRPALTTLPLALASAVLAVPQETQL